MLRCLAALAVVLAAAVPARANDMVDLICCSPRETEPTWERFREPILLVNAGYGANGALSGVGIGYRWGSREDTFFGADKANTVAAGLHLDGRRAGWATYGRTLLWPIRVELGVMFDADGAGPLARLAFGPLRFTAAKLSGERDPYGAFDLSISIPLVD